MIWQDIKKWGCLKNKQFNIELEKMFTKELCSQKRKKKKNVNKP